MRHPDAQLETVYGRNARQTGSPAAILHIRNGFTVKIRNFSSGRICSPSVPVVEIEESATSTPSEPVAPDTVYAIHTPQQFLPIADGKLTKIHLRQAHSAEYALANQLKAGMSVIDKAQMR